MGKKIKQIYLFHKAMMLEKIVTHCIKNKYTKEGNLERGSQTK